MTSILDSQHAFECKDLLVKIGNSVLVNNVNIAARRGSLIGLLGESGVGKSSLLKAISCRIPHISGDMTLYGDKINRTISKRKIGFVTQESYFTDELTTIETMQMYAFFKNQSVEKVNQVIKLVQLQKCQDNRVSVLSGGERKRLSIAIELLSYKDMLLVDEPVSGLDYPSALNIINVLKDISRTGTIIILSIHQPSWEMTSLFDRMLFLKTGGTLVCDIPISHLQHFVTKNSTAIKNPIDHIFNIIISDSHIDKNSAVWSQFDLDDHPNQIETTQTDFKHNSNQSIDFKHNSLDNSDQSIDINQSPQDERDEVSRLFMFFLCLKWLLWRQYIKRFRNKEYLSVIDILISGILIGLCYLQNSSNSSNSNDPVYILQTMSILTLIINYYSFIIPMYATLLIAPSDWSLAEYERNNGFYSLLCYHFSKIISDSIFQIGHVTLVVVIIYTMTSIGTFTQFLQSYVLIIFTISISASFGTMIGTIFATSRRQYSTVNYIWILTWISFGTLAPLSRINYILQKFLKIFVIRYCFLGVINIHFDRDAVAPTIGNNVQNQLYEYFQVDLNYSQCLGVLIASWIGINMLSFFLSTFMNRKYKS
jgi:ABC-type multidrug transport system ATPase subunit